MTKSSPTTVPIVLRSTNELDLSAVDLAELSHEMACAFPMNSPVQVEVDVLPSYGAGNGWIDTLLIWLPTAELIREHLYGPAMDAAVAFMKRRFSRKHESERPRQIQILYGPDNRVLREVTMDTPDDIVDP